MAENQNSDVTKHLVEATRNQNAIGDIPKGISPNIVPTFELNDFIVGKDFSKSLNVTVTGGGTIYSTPANADFYLTGACVSVAKDVVCDLASGEVNITYVDEFNGAATIAGVAIITLTAERGEVFISLAHPIKVLRNSTIDLGGSVAFAAGNASISGFITGFIGNYSSSS